jgi:hypothetical protein
MRTSIKGLLTLAMLTVATLSIGPTRLSIAAESLIGKVTMERTSSGLSIAGTIQKVPPGTKTRIEIVRKAGRALKPMDQPGADAIVAPDGSFRASLSNSNGAAFAAGTYTVQITAIFNMFWQSVEVLQKAGVELDGQGRSGLQTNPKALPETPDFKAFDAEFPSAGRYIEVRRDITVPALPSDAAAIEAVKNARLTVQGRGRSDLPVGKSVEWFASASGLSQTAWSAVQGAEGKWTVTLDCVDGGKEKRAQWEYNSRTKAVRYLDPLAKTLSYVPPE